MLNGIFLVAVLLSVQVAAWTGRMEPLTNAIVTDAGKAVTLAIGLVGTMAFFLGLLQVAADGGAMRRLSRLVGPVLHRLFPDVPANHPAMSAMTLNITSNMLGLANAATPFGIRAMEELDRLNGEKGTATNAMALFLAINTSALAIFPTGVIALRASAGSADPAGILVTTWVASGTATIVAILAASLLARAPWVRRTAPPATSDEVASGEEIDAESDEDLLVPPRFGRWIHRGFWLALAAAVAASAGSSGGAGSLFREVSSFWLLPALVGGILVWGWSRGVRVYESLVEGGKQGFDVALRIIPYLVAILVAVGMLRASGIIELLEATLGAWTARVGLPAEALPMALLRPLSGSGAYGVMAGIMEEHGPDSLVGYLVSTFQGSTETTFYVLAVYYGAVGIRRTRHTLAACLAADVAGITAAVAIVNLLYG